LALGQVEEPVAGDAPGEALCVGRPVVTSRAWNGKAFEPCNSALLLKVLGIDPTPQGSSDHALQARGAYRTHSRSGWHL
jgi:hypothetical protein